MTQVKSNNNVCTSAVDFNFQLNTSCLQTKQYTFTRYSITTFSSQYLIITSVKMNQLLVLSRVYVDSILLEHLYNLCSDELINSQIVSTIFISVICKTIHKQQYLDMWTI